MICGFNSVLRTFYDELCFLRLVFGVTRPPRRSSYTQTVQSAMYDCWQSNLLSQKSAGTSVDQRSRAFVESRALSPGANFHRVAFVTKNSKPTSRVEHTAKIYQVIEGGTQMASALLTYQ